MSPLRRCESRPASAQRPKEGAHVRFNVKDLPTLYEQLSAQGVRFVTPPTVQTHSDGRRTGICYAQDPEGNWLEFIQPG